MLGSPDGAVRHGAEQHHRLLRQAQIRYHYSVFPYGFNPNLA
jgi:hypothetical protein